MNNQKDNPNHKPYYHVIDTWYEFLDTIKNYKPNPGADYTDGRASQRNEDGETIPWSGAHNWKEALNFLDKGWQEGLDQIKRIQENQIPPDLFDCIMPIEDYKPHMKHQIAGGTLDVGQFVTGASPENFVAEVVDHEASEKVKGKKLITIYIQSFNSCCMGYDAFMYRGAYTYSMIEHLENCGYSVELWTVHYCMAGRYSNTPQTQKIYIKVKEFGELFDTNKLAISLCSPFYMRRFIFALQESFEDIGEVNAAVQNAYCYPATGNVEDVALPEDLDINPLWIPLQNIGSPEQTLELYKKLLDGYTSGNVLTE